MINGDIIGAFMDALAAAAGVLSADQIAAYLREVAVYARAWDRYEGRAQDTLEEIRTMVAEGRQPTDFEVAAVKARIAAASGSIQGEQ